MYGNEGLLPFTGSVFTLPLFILGLIITAAGVIMRKTHSA